MQVYELNFRGAKLIGVKHDGRIVIPIKPIADAIGIDWSSQHKAIQRHTILSKGMVVMTIPFGQGGTQMMACLPLNRLHFWLAGVESGRIKGDDIRARVIEFQEECADALFVYFMPEYAAAIGVKLPTLEARLLHDDLFDRAEHIDRTGQARPFGYDPDDP
jgi:hypothetical protein